MKIFDLDIRYPHHMLEQPAEHQSEIAADDILTQFDRFNWRKQRVMQLELDGVECCFTVTNSQQKQWLRLILNGYAASDDFEFKLESNIALMLAKKDMFGLITLKKKVYIHLKTLTLNQAREFLVHFINQDVQALEQYYQKINVTSKK